MAQETDSSDLLTVDERFFLHIALKNGLLDQERADRAMAHCRERERSLEESLRDLGILDEAQALKVREAMAASQVVRLDTVYGDVAVSRGFISREAVDGAFQEQRRQRYRVRLGNLLVERGLLDQDQHRAIISDVIKRLRQLGPDAYTSTVHRREAQAERQALGNPSGGSSLGPARGSSRVSASSPPPTSASDPRGLPPPSFALGLDTARGWGAPLPGVDNSVMETRNPAAGGGATIADPLVESAIRIGMESDSKALPLHRSDEEAMKRDLEALGKGAEQGGGSASFVLDRMALSASAEEFEAEEYVKRRRRRQRLLLAGAGVLAAALLALVVSVILALVQNRHAVADVRALLAEAQSVSDAESKRQTYLRATDRLSDVGSLGVSQVTRDELRDRARWGALQAEALALMAQGKPEEAGQLLERRRDEVPAALHVEYDALLRQTARDRALGLAQAAERASDWPSAVAAYRDAREHGDPGGVAGSRLTAIRDALSREMDARYQRALTSLDEADEEAFTGAAKLITELFNDDPGVTERLEEIQFRRALARGEQALRRDELEQALQRFETARRLRPASRDVAAWLERIGGRKQLLEEEARGAEAERQGRFAEAIERYRRALSLVTREDERRRLDAALERCDDLSRQDAERQRRGAQLAEAIQRLRGSRVAEAVTLLEALGREPRPDPAVPRLLAFARKATGMVYVPAGPFLMGSAPGGPGRPVEQPRREVDLPAFYILRTEVTNARYAELVATGAAPPPAHWTHPARQPDGSVRTSFDPALGDHPVVNVTWVQARAYAEWRGGLLPTEPQWEKAARGADGRTFPWGERTDVRVHVQVAPDRLRGHPTAPVGAFADDTSPCGAQDMAGNVGEWTRDPFAPYPGAPAGLDWPAGRRTIRGGAYRWRLDDARCAARDRGEEDGYVSPTVGFRYVLEVPADLTQLR